MRMDASNRQEMRMNQAMHQAMSVLSFSILELADYLSECIDKNPLVERRGPALCIEQDAPSLYTYLMEQAYHTFSDVSKAEKIIGSLNEKGFLTEPIEDLETLEIIQGFDPLGIAVKDTRESLLLQLKEKKTSLGYRIIAECYDDMLHAKWDKISKTLKVPIECIQRALKQEIRPLDPFPGYRFRPSHNNVCVHDLSILEEMDSWVIEVNESLLPSYEMVPQNEVYYRKFTAAIKWLERTLKRRRSLLLKLGKIIAKHHGSFLRGEDVGMQPLKMCDVARELNLNESTITRAVANKTVLCPLGMKPLRFFFNTNHRAKELLLRLIKSEDKKAPFSDDMLATLLKRQGECLARRTVAKYRKQLGIMSASQRKAWGKE